MTAPRKLRPYQTEAVNAVLAYWGAPHETNRWTPVVVLPTGTGKSTVIAKLATTARDMGQRVVMLAHRRELLDQMAASVAVVDPASPPVGIVQGERNHNPQAGIVAASFQTLQSPARLESLGKRDVVLCDEAHHSTCPTYMSVLDRLGVVSPDPLSPTWACGFTATAHREDGGLGQVWDSVVYERSLVWAIRQGFLVKPRGLTVVLPGLDLSKVTVRAGDYAQGELEGVMAASTETTVMAMLTHAKGRRPIVFAAGVCHAEELAHALTKHGITAAAVTGAMSTSEREDAYNQFRDGTLQAMVTVQVLTEGADFPMCDTVVMARPTRSQTLYSQMVGRAVRLHEGKTDALVLDLAGTVRDMSLITLSNLDPTLKAKRVSVDSTEDPGQKEPVKRERKERLGAVDLEDWDLVAASVSKANWLRTPGGIRFLDGQNNVLVFLWPENNGLYSAGLMHTPLQPSVDGFVCPSVGLKDAILVAEDVLKGYGKFPLRSAAWRRKGKPSEAQLRMARCLGIPDAGKKTRARLSDDISTVLAARLLDPYLKGN